MATTIRSDLIIPEVLEDAIRGEFANAQALYGTGAAIVNTRGFPDARGGDRIKIPYFGTLGDFEDLAADEGAGGAVPALTPSKITMDADTALVLHSGKAFEVTEWARIATAYADPYAEAARQLRVGLQRRADLALITNALATSLVHNIYDATTAASGELTWQQVIDARYVWGDEQDDIALMIVHSDVAKNLMQQVDDNGRPIYEQAALQNGRLAQINGIPLITSDKMTKTADYGGGGTDTTGYESLILKRNALAWWMQGDAPVQMDSDILADTEIAATHVYWAAHRYRRPNGGTKEGVVKIIHNVA